MQTLIAGYLAEKTPRADGRKVEHPNRWHPYPHLKDDHEKFNKLAKELATLCPVPPSEDAGTYFFDQMAPGVAGLFASAAAALDAIQDAVMACDNDELSASEIESLPAVSKLLSTF